MTLELFKPKNPALAAYMEGYYFLTKEAGDKDMEYLTFPNNYSIISVCEGIEMEFGPNSVIANSTTNGKFISSLICHYKKPIRVSIKGSINEITFYFKPLGLNAFLKKPLKQYTDTFFNSFMPFDDYKTSMISILHEKDFEQRKEMIEEYWLSKFEGFSHPFLGKLADDMVSDPEISLAELSAQYKTSRQTVNKLFDLHLCKSPSDFRKIQRFRETLLSSMDKKISMTELSYDHLFYDQSHLIKDFKSLTDSTPKKLFQNVSFYQDGSVNWFFL
ncbi:helix-turn-helix domain-containing protein [Chryseobacterium oleae]|nr:AraC family transcriptional regulator [Chryseobacterium oleae]